MPHVLVAGRIHDAGLALLRAADGVTFDVVDEVSVEAYAPLIGRADALVIRTQPLRADLIARANALKIVSRHGVGYDAVDVEALNRRGIPLAIVGDVNSRPVAEQTMMMMLAIAKRALRHDRATREGRWSERDNFGATELDGKILLLVGFGRIGRIVAKMAAAFGMIVLAHDSFLDDATILGAGARPAPDLDAALAIADYVSLHVPLTGGEAVIGAAELSLMKPTAVVINTARGGLVDEAALAAALDRNQLAGAGLDVFAREPPTPDNPLLESAATIVSPHIAGVTAESAARMSAKSVRNVLDFFAGGLDLGLVVNRVNVFNSPEVRS